MRIPSSLGLTADALPLLSSWLLLSLLLPSTLGVDFTPVPLPDLDLRDLGRVALTGDFDSISLYTYQQQSEDAFSTNGTQSVITQLPNGNFANTASGDGYIKTMCPFITSDGMLQGVILGGNFTSIGGVPAQGVALYDPGTGKVSPLPGLTGTANTLYCDPEIDTVFVGGQFKGANSTNAIIWVGKQGWVNLPFEGFNGPVNSIVKGTNDTIIFGGSFTGLGNKTTPAKKDSQVINIASANLTSAETTSTDGFNKESNIVCKTDGQDGAGNTWLLQDNTPGWWRADMNFGYEPSLLRIWNTHYQGRGTKTFRFTAIPINGIMNFTYTDPATGAEDLVCDARCPLSSDPSVPYQDFRFVNTVGMSAFRIDISEWHGAGGGLNGVALYQNDIFSYAENNLNEPTCANTDFPSKSTQTGPWNLMPSAESVSRYLAADLSGDDIGSQDVSLTFQPDIKQQGNYSVTMFTPGCKQDNTCDKRHIVNVTGVFSTSTGSDRPVSTQIFQTNDYDKYDEIYRGPVDISSGGFRPSVTITPLDSQKESITVVAQRVQFSLVGNATSSLNGLYEFDPRAKEVSSDFFDSTVDNAGANLETGAAVNSIAVIDKTMFVAGNFSDPSAGFANIFALGGGNATALANGGLNDQVSSLLVFEDILYIGGNFTNTLNSSVPGLNNVASYDPAKSEWQALGAGVSGAVDTVVGFTMNVTTNTPELVIAFNGHFAEIQASGSDKAIAVDGFAIWVPSRRNWLRRLNLPSQAVTGKLSTMTNITNQAPILAGTLSAQDLSASDVVTLQDSPLRLNSLNAGIQPSTAGPQTRKRAVSGSGASGVVAGLFYNENGANVTVLGGHFTGTASDGNAIENLVFLDGSSNGAITGLASGLESDSTFLAMDTSGNNLFAGGSVTGKVNDADVNGLVVYDLSRKAFASPQPPALGGNDVVVNAVAVPPKKQQVFVGGNFETAGSLPCRSVCIFDNGAWSQPGSGIAGTVNAFAWQGNNKLLVGGNLTVAENATSLASFDLQKSEWTAVEGASENVPGAITALTQADSDESHFWLAGKANNGSAFLIKYDGRQFRSAGDLLGPDTTIHGLAMYNLRKAHGNGNALIPSSLILMLLGELQLPDFGSASAALFNGTTFTPYALTNSGNGPGRLAQLISEKKVNFRNQGGNMAVGFVVLIALACALGAVFLLVVAGILIERYRRRKEGYTPAPTAYFDKTTNMGRIPPEHLFGRLGQKRESPML